MALITCEFFSETLTLTVPITVILPERRVMEQGADADGKCPVLYLLHGFSDDQSMWVRQTSIERYAANKGIAVVMPEVGHSFYNDMVYGNRYWTFITKELPEVVQTYFPLSGKREANFVAGLSMGGYGAFKWALRYPERFAAAASLSGVLDIGSRVDRADAEDPISTAFKLAFGEGDISTENDILYLVTEVDKSEGPKPILFQACGTEDGLYADNIQFKETCDKTHMDLTTHFGPGGHDWGYWDEQIQHVLEWLPIPSLP